MRELTPRQVMRKAMQKFIATLPDDEAVELSSVFEDYKVNTAYKTGDMFNYNGGLYRVIQQHTSQANWPPNGTASLYKAVGFNDSGIPIWTQPIGYEDAFSIGDLVSHKDKIWVCEQGNASGANGMRNTFEPGVWGWTLN